MSAGFRTPLFILGISTVDIDPLTFGVISIIGKYDKGVISTISQYGQGIVDKL